MKFLRLMTTVLLMTIAGCEPYVDEADDAPPDPVAQCYELAAAFCEGATACGQPDAPIDGCVEYIAGGQCEVNQTVIPPDVLEARAGELRALACDNAPTAAQRADGQAAGAVLWAMLQW